MHSAPREEEKETRACSNEFLESQKKTETGFKRARVPYANYTIRFLCASLTKFSGTASQLCQLRLRSELAGAAFEPTPTLLIRPRTHRVLYAKRSAAATFVVERTADVHSALNGAFFF